jgi:hypothetical protein
MIETFSTELKMGVEPMTFLIGNVVPTSIQIIFEKPTIGMRHSTVEVDVVPLAFGLFFVANPRVELGFGGL